MYAAGSEPPGEAQHIDLDMDALAELELENAYGRFFRSRALQAAAI